MEVVARVLSLLCGSNGSVRMSFTSEGLTVSVPFSSERQLFALAASSFLSKPVLLKEQELKAECQRVVSLFDNLVAGQQGMVELISNLHFSQVYHIVRHLRQKGFAVEPDAEQIVLPEKDGRTGLRFRLTARKSVVLFVQRGYSTLWHVTAQLETAPIRPSLDGLQLDELPMEQLVGLVPPDKTEVLRKEGQAEQPEFRRNGDRPRPAGDGSGGGGIDRALKEVRGDLKRRGVYGLPLDFSLLKPPRSHQGSRFFKRPRGRMGAGFDGRFHGEV